MFAISASLGSRRGHQTWAAIIPELKGRWELGWRKQPSDTRHWVQILKPQNIFICLEKNVCWRSWIISDSVCITLPAYKIQIFNNEKHPLHCQNSNSHCGHTQMQRRSNLWSCMNKPVCNIPFSYPGHTKPVCKFFVSKIRYNLVLFRLECRLCLVVNLIYNAVACIPSHAPSKTWSWLWLTMIWHCRL